jgi:glycosyltransferase involved in cell wall biosynthesis
MRNEVPVAACGLPGVRQPVTMTGMGEVTPVGDADALAQSLIAILDDVAAYRRDAALIGKSFSPDQTAAEYLRLFRALQSGQASPDAAEPKAYDQLRQMRRQYEEEE